uniref:STING ligand-binding domain-containing protein n=1 Tax=Lygus hesperus TaxID=30085 RepID=A0A0A9XJH5_LYGHE
MERGLSPVDMKWVCIGAAGIAFLGLYHKWYTKRMEGVFDLERVMRAHLELERFGLDYGSSLADNYFHGYLEIILPKGLSDQGFRGRVQQYKKEQQLQKEKFPEKIFVIVHKSGFSPNSYDDHSRFESRKKMEFEVEGRSGIRRRRYQTSVYKVKSHDGKEEITVVMEGAPCLRQLYEAAKVNPALKEMSDIVISTFMTKIRAKIDNDGYCRGLCELVYVDDSPGSETTGRGGLDWLANKLFEIVKLDKQEYFR